MKGDELDWIKEKTGRRLEAHLSEQNRHISQDETRISGRVTPNSDGFRNPALDKTHSDRMNQSQADLDQKRMEVYKNLRNRNAANTMVPASDVFNRATQRTPQTAAATTHVMNYVILIGAITGVAILLFMYGLRVVPGHGLAEKVTNLKTMGLELWEKYNPLSTVLNFYTEQWDLTMGDLYTSQVDDSSKEPLGVYMDPLQLPGDTLYAGQRMSMYSYIKVNTFEKPVDVKMYCSVDEIMGTVYPDSTFAVRDYDEHSVDCFFDEGVIDAGSHIATMKATFNFDTTAYQKVYFIDRAKYEDIVYKQKKSIWDVYKTDDPNPFAVTSEGPVNIGMEIGTSQPIIIGTSGTQATQPYLGFTLKNAWDGIIDKVKSITVYLPLGTSLNNEFCTAEFEESSSDMDGYTAYAMKNADVLKNITRYHTVRCQVNIDDPSSLLEDNPIVHKFIFVKTSYSYTITQKKGVSIMSYDSKCSDATNKGKSCGNDRVCDGESCISKCRFCASNPGSGEKYPDVICDAAITSRYTCTNKESKDTCFENLCPGELNCCDRTKLITSGSP